MDFIDQLRAFSQRKACPRCVKAKSIRLSASWFCFTCNWKQTVNVGETETLSIVWLPHWMVRDSCAFRMMAIDYWLLICITNSRTVVASTKWRCSLLQPASAGAITFAIMSQLIVPGPITKFSTKSRVHSVFFGQHATHPTSCNNVTKTVNDCMTTNDFSLLTILTSTQCRYVQTEVSLIFDYVFMFFVTSLITKFNSGNSFTNQPVPVSSVFMHVLPGKMWSTLIQHFTTHKYSKL